MTFSLRTARTTIENAIIDTIWFALGRRQAVADLSALRALPSAALPLSVLRFVTAVGYAFVWRRYETTADDGATVIQPADVGAGKPGRWVKTTSTAPTGYLARCELFNDSGGDDEVLLQRLFGQVPAIVLTFQGAKHDPMSMQPGALYKYTADFTLAAISISERGDQDAARQGSPVASEAANDPGTSAMIGDAKQILAGEDLNIFDLMRVELGDERPISVALAERRAYEELDLVVTATVAKDDADVTPLADPFAFNAQMRLADAPGGTAYDPDNSVNGGRVPLGDGLTKTIPAFTAVIGGVTVAVPATPRTFGPSVATYRDLRADGTYLFLEAAVDAPAPAVSYGALRVGVTVTDSTGVREDALLCSALENFGPVNKIDPPAIVSLFLNLSSASVPAGTPIAFTATATYDDGTTGDVTQIVAWSSSTPSVATIDQAGIATTLVAGSTQITATTGGVTSTPATLTVT